MTTPTALEAARLTNRERSCLELVREGYSSKEIGPKLGISHHTVDEYVRSATRKLGVANRHEAARMVFTPQSAPYENPSTPPPPRLGDEPVAIASTPSFPQQSLPDRSKMPSPFGRVAILRNGRRVNDLKIGERLMYIIAGAVLIVFSLNWLAGGMLEIQSIFRGR